MGSSRNSITLRLEVISLDDSISLTFIQSSPLTRFNYFISNSATIVSKGVAFSKASLVCSLSSLLFPSSTLLASITRIACLLHFQALSSVGRLQCSG